MLKGFFFIYFFTSLTINKHENLQCSGLPSLRCPLEVFAVKLVAFCLLLWFADNYYTF